MSKIIILVLLLSILVHDTKSTEDAKKSKTFAHYFRKQIEEIEDVNSAEINITNNARHNLVQFLIRNVKEIFGDLVERTDIKENTSTMTSKIVFSYSTALSEIQPITTLSTYIHDVMLYENLTITTLIDKKYRDTNKDRSLKTERDELLHLSKDLKLFTEPDAKGMIPQPERRKRPHNQGNSSVPESETVDIIRSCISCDNVQLEDCTDPRNKLIPSVVCQHDDDLCYSLHTPFGIIDRGCFSVNHNLTTYVCSCNLCNYISISEMPYIFSNKQDWVDNVVEVSRTRNFRKSVFKDMSCLRCEVNATIKVGDMLDSANCLEGNVGNLPVEPCTEDEVCAVKAVRSEGYIWRGCAKMPLYNYWWALCDNDLCNYDTLISIYDYI